MDHSSGRQSTPSLRRGRSRKTLNGMLVAVVGVTLGVLDVPSAALAAGNSALTAQYADGQVTAVNRSPAFPACTGSIVMSAGASRYNTRPYSEAANGSVDLATAVSGGGYLKIVASANPSQPWGIKMFQTGTDLEAKWYSGSWVLPGDPNYGSAAQFTPAGQAYGLYSGGFLHNSSVRGFGNFFLIDQTWPAADTLTYTPDPAQNVCQSSQSVADATAMENGGQTDTPTTEIASSTPPPWLQSYGRSAGETCRAGWHPSWAEWAADKTGGWVCNRAVLMIGSTWVQNPNAVWGSYNASENVVWDGR